MHEHFDVDGDPTGTTVVTRASLWTAHARAQARALVEYEDSIDARTGLPAAEAYKDQQFVVTDVTNFAERSIEQRKRADQADAKKDGQADGWDDGVKYHVRPATPDEIQEAQAEQEVDDGD